MKISIFWHRRDLRITDNTGLYHALNSGTPVLPIFIFDTNILDKLEDKTDARVTFIHSEISKIKLELEKLGSSLKIFYGNPLQCFHELAKEYDIAGVYTNTDYEPYARERDQSIEEFLTNQGIEFKTYKDHVIFEKNDVLKDDGKPYTVYTPFSKKWLANLKDSDLVEYENAKLYTNYLKLIPQKNITLHDMGFKPSPIPIPSRELDLSVIKSYKEQRDIPSILGTSRLSIHLRFGTVSIRHLTKIAQRTNFAWLNELIWRNFYTFIIWHFPHSVKNSFKPQYDKIPWRNNETEFDAWCKGNTGYPIVDAGMRELNTTGFMHNRVRMITASFLTKHLLIDWRWGEAYFAKKLLDFDLASNNGGWQWAASSGCDAAPYFRVFSPELQTQKFDPQLKYIKKWVPEFQEFDYSKPIVNHSFARERAISTFKKALSKEEL
jgi:deoxyribodipyrimidine photo-lyase